MRKLITILASCVFILALILVWPFVKINSWAEKTAAKMNGVH